MFRNVTVQPVITSALPSCSGTFFPPPPSPDSQPVLVRGVCVELPERRGRLLLSQARDTRSPGNVRPAGVRGQAEGSEAEGSEVAAPASAPGVTCPSKPGRSEPRSWSPPARGWACAAGRGPRSGCRCASPGATHGSCDLCVWDLAWWPGRWKLPGGALTAGLWRRLVKTAQQTIRDPAAVIIETLPRTGMACCGDTPRDSGGPFSLGVLSEQTLGAQRARRRGDEGIHAGRGPEALAEGPGGGPRGWSAGNAGERFEVQGEAGGPVELTPSSRGHGEAP